MDLKMLIYSKSFNGELTHELLRIADSPTLVEDLIDLIKDMSDEGDSNSCNCCMTVEDLKDEKSLLEEELNELKSDIGDKVGKLKDQISFCEDAAGEIEELL